MTQVTQVTIVRYGEGAAVVLPESVLKSTGLHIGDVLEATVDDRQLILRPTTQDPARREAFENIVKDVFEKRRDAYQRLA